HYTMASTRLYSLPGNGLTHCRQVAQNTVDDIKGCPRAAQTPGICHLPVHSCRSRLHESAYRIDQLYWITRQHSHIVLQHIFDVSFFLPGDIAAKNNGQFTGQGFANRSWPCFGHNHIRGTHHLWHIVHKTKDPGRYVQVRTDTLE